MRRRRWRRSIEYRGRIHATSILIIPVNLCMLPIAEAEHEGHHSHIRTDRKSGCFKVTHFFEVCQNAGSSGGNIDDGDPILGVRWNCTALDEHGAADRSDL